jgi:hypothetical protein
LTTHRHLPRRHRHEPMALLAVNRRLFKAYLFNEQFKYARAE